MHTDLKNYYEYYTKKISDFSAQYLETTGRLPTEENLKDYFARKAPDIKYDTLKSF